MNESLVLTDDIAAVSKIPQFKANGVACDVRGKSDGRLDLCVVHSERPCAGAGVFTLNDVQAAPVVLTRQLLSTGNAMHGIVCNSGNANACTGDQGLLDAEKMSFETSSKAKAPQGSFLVCSTGRIGEPMPIVRIVSGIDNCVHTLSHLPDAAERASQAILTSDTRPKGCLVSWESDGHSLSLGGFAKGAGMIEPNMATMLAFLFTDVMMKQGLLQEVLSASVRKSFNRISIDGDMSTNDTVLLLANGASEQEISEKTPKALEDFHDAVDRACLDLAEKIVSDGERITKVVRLEIEGAPDDASAEKVARSVGNSLLVKTSWYGSDPNWGRLVHAAGYARVGVQMDSIDLFYEDAPALLKGVPQVENRERWKEVVSAERFTIRINLNLGMGCCTMLSTDLTEGYVDFNKSE